MITNQSLTIYHKELDTQTKLEKWTRHNYKNVWFYGGKGASVNAGYENANDVSIRIPLTEVADVTTISIGDILVKGDIATDIITQQDLKDFEVYNITSINNNNFGFHPHIHIGGK